MVKKIIKELKYGTQHGIGIPYASVVGTIKYQNVAKNMLLQTSIRS